MDIELKFVKSSSDVWGFRLTGGAEYDVPFTVVNVAKNSIAENGGLRCNDIITSVNGICIEDLTHHDTHNLLLNVGNNLVLGIRRNLTELISPVTNDEETNEEVTNIMQSQFEVEEHFEHERQMDFELIDPSDRRNGTTEVYTSSSEATSKHSGSDLEMTERKWSTFLQKPKNPAPKKKEEAVPKGEPYRVIIKKQNKKSVEDLENDLLKTQILPSEEENFPETKDLNFAEMEEGNPDTTNNLSQMEEHLCGEEIINETEISAEKNVPSGENIFPEPDEAIHMNESTDENENEKNAQLDKLLEEKLAEVQKQLEALSKLPSTIQSTIDAVTKQIACIVHTTTNTQPDIREETLEINSDSEDELAERSVTESTSSKEMGDNLEEHVEQEIHNGETSEGDDDVQDAETKEEYLEEVTENLESERRLTEEEEEAKRIGQELLEKQQKERAVLEEFKQRRLKQKPTLPLKPVERPIILPGGRRWSQPDDACPVARHAKMSDEKIANTIETYSEVIVGKAKGINFMKYQPPPKNLDYLQRSDVYKLVHNLEPPVRGISSRSPKILSEQDYYQTG